MTKIEARLHDLMRYDLTWPERQEAKLLLSFLDHA
jgi:hypothetical protein